VAGRLGQAPPAQARQPNLQAYRSRASCMCQVLDACYPMAFTQNSKNEGRMRRTFGCGVSRVLLRESAFSHWREEWTAGGAWAWAWVAAQLLDKCLQVNIVHRKQQRHTGLRYGTKCHGSSPRRSAPQAFSPPAPCRQDLPAPAAVADVACWPGCQRPALRRGRDRNCDTLRW
jgi:hypothetical protein